METLTIVAQVCFFLAVIFGLENAMRARRGMLLLSGVFLGLALFMLTLAEPAIEATKGFVRSVGQVVILTAKNIKIERVPPEKEPSTETKTANESLQKDQSRLTSDGRIGLRTRQAWIGEKPRSTGLPRFTTVYPRHRQMPDYDVIANQNSELIAVFAALELGQWSMAETWADKLLKKIDSFPANFSILTTGQVTELKGIAILEQGLPGKAATEFEKSLNLLESGRADSLVLDRARINLAIARAMANRPTQLDSRIYSRLSANSGEHLQELSLYYLARSLQKEMEGAFQLSDQAYQDSIGFSQKYSKVNSIAANRLAILLGQDSASLQVDADGAPSEAVTTLSVSASKQDAENLSPPASDKFSTGGVKDDGPPRFTSVYPRQKQLANYDEVSVAIPLVAQMFENLENGHWKMAEKQAYAAMLQADRLPFHRRKLFLAQMQEMLGIAKLERGMVAPALDHFKVARSKMIEAGADITFLDRLDLNLSIAAIAVGSFTSVDEDADTRFFSSIQNNFQELVLFYHIRSLEEQRLGKLESARFSHSEALRYLERYEMQEPAASKRLAFVKAPATSTATVPISNTTRVEKAPVSTILSPPRTITYPIETLVPDFDTLKFQDFRFFELKNRWEAEDWIGVRDFTIELESWLDRYPFDPNSLALQGAAAKAGLMHMRAVAHMNMGEPGRAMQLLSAARDKLSAKEELSFAEIRIRLDLALIYLMSSTPNTVVTQQMEKKLLSSAQDHPLELALYYRHAALSVWSRDKKLAIQYLQSAKDYVPMVGKLGPRRAKQLGDLLAQNEGAIAG